MTGAAGNYHPESGILYSTSHIWSVAVLKNQLV